MGPPVFHLFCKDTVELLIKIHLKVAGGSFEGCVSWSAVVLFLGSGRVGRLNYREAEKKFLGPKPYFPIPDP